MSSFRRFRNLLLQADIVVDAILGTGLNDAVKGLYKHVVRRSTKRTKPIIAVDIPSGLSADTGMVYGSCIKADVTVTFAIPKRGVILYPARIMLARWKSWILVFPKPAFLVRDQSSPCGICERSRESFGNGCQYAQNCYGHVVVIAGSPGKSGAALMAGRSALRAGAGLVTLAVPENLRAPLEIPTLEVMTASLPETAQGTVSVDAYEHIMNLVQDKRVVAIGHGLSVHPSTVELVFRLIHARLKFRWCLMRTPLMRSPKILRFCSKQKRR